MIQTYTFTVPLKDPATAEASATKLRGEVHRLAKFNTHLLGCVVAVATAALDVQIRYSGTDRWRIQRSVRKVVTLTLTRAQLAFRDAVFVSVEDMPDGRALTLEEGRTPMTAQPRTARGPVGGRDFEQWWGDVPAGQ